MFYYTLRLNCGAVHILYGRNENMLEIYVENHILDCIAYLCYLMNMLFYTILYPGMYLFILQLEFAVGLWVERCHCVVICVVIGSAMDLFIQF